MTKVKSRLCCSCGGTKTTTPSKVHPSAVHSRSPAQSKAKKVISKYKYKKGYRVSPGKIQRTKDALSEIDSGSSVCKAARKYCLSESMLRRRLSGEVSVESRNGPRPVFSCQEETEMALWLSEMAKRGMGLGPSDFLDFVQGILKKDKRKTNFKDDRPTYNWYYNFMARNSHLVEKRKESSLENSRAKVTSKQLDNWFQKYYQFVSQLHLLDQPHRIYNADESGFSMGSKPSSVIGPTKQNCPTNLPHLCGQTKKRLTGMFCANADGEVIPPFLIYPQPTPLSYDPMIGSRKGTVIAYTEKGWMNSKTFLEFMKHFDKFACQERPVILLIDSVSSHMSVDAFSFAKNRSIELYRLQPNATHFLQPLDNGVFGPLKKVWYQVVRKFTKEHPGQSIGKENFAAKLNEAFMQFYRPHTVTNSFKTTGIYPVDRSRISEDNVKPAVTFQDTTSDSGKESCSVLVAEKSSTCTESSSVTQTQLDCSVSGLSLLADVALTDTNNNTLDTASKPEESENVRDATCESVSPSLLEALTYPTSSTTENKNPKKRKTVVDSRSDCLTSSESIRESALKQLEGVRKFARKEQKAKTVYLKSLTQKTVSKKLGKRSTTKCSKRIQSSVKRKSGIGTSLCTSKTDVKATAEKSGSCLTKQGQSVAVTVNPERKSKRSFTAKKTLFQDTCTSINEELSIVCKKPESADDMHWIQCDLCDSWTHVSCIPDNHDYDHRATTCDDIDYYCHICVT